MADVYDCPCGAHVTDPDGAVTYVTDAIIDAVFSGVVSKLKYLGVLAPFIGAPLDVAAICASPKPRQPEWELSDFANPQAALLKASQMLRAKVYELNCTCDDCPPATACNTGTCIIVGPDDGYLEDPDQPDVLTYRIPPSVATYSARAADGACYGFKSGINITWHINGVFDPANGVSVCNYNGTGCNSWSQNVLPGSVQICIDGHAEPPPEPIPEAPAGVDDWYGPPACSNSDICASLAITEERIRRIEFLTTVIAGPLYGVTAPITSTFPGISTPITGTLVEYLARALPALAPIQPSQLANPATEVITEPSLVDVTGLAYVNIVPTVIPPSMGYTGDGPTLYYFSSSKAPGPGYVLILGQEGVLASHIIHFPTGLELPIPSTATGLAIEVTPGVTMAVTTWERQV